MLILSRTAITFLVPIIGEMTRNYKIKRNSWMYLAADCGWSYIWSIWNNSSGKFQSTFGNILMRLERKFRMLIIVFVLSEQIFETVKNLFLSRDFQVRVRCLRWEYVRSLEASQFGARSARAIETNTQQCHTFLQKKKIRWKVSLSNAILTG